MAVCRRMVDLSVGSCHGQDVEAGTSVDMGGWLDNPLRVPTVGGAAVQFFQ